MIGMRYLVVCALPLLLGLSLSGCDIQPEERLTGSPIGGTPPGSLDEQSDDNIIAYFYAGKPVAGLLYSCSRSDIVEYSGVTDENGRFVCPRTNKVSFFVGVSRVETIKLGEIELEIYGSSSTPGKRNNVVITPATLYGTSVSGSKREIINIFNLLYSLDKKTPADRKQQVIDLNPEVLVEAVAEPAFLALVNSVSASSKGVAAQTSSFGNSLKLLVDALVISGNSLTLAEANPAAPTLTAEEAIDIADAALMRAHAGLYRSNSSMLDSQVGSVFLGTSEFMVGADGAVSGLTIAEEYTAVSTTSAYRLDVLEVNSASRVLADGTLQGFRFGSGTRELNFFGTLVNDYIWGESRLCQPDSFNIFVPEIFCLAGVDDGGFSTLDVGTFEAANGYSGELFIGQPFSSFPDIDLDHLPDNYLPRTYEMQLSRYTEVTFGNLSSADYDGASDDKAAFGPLQALPMPAGKVRYTLLPNGDIVSDVDADCSNLALVGGRYEDADGSREFLIGRVGSIFTLDVQNTPDESDDNTYLDVYLNILDSAHPNYGLTVGVGALYRRALHEVVLEESANPVTNGKLRSKSCDPTVSITCNDKIEWFNNIRYVNEVYAVDRATSNELTASDIANYRNAAYYGQVIDNVQVEDPTPGSFSPGDICVYSPPPPPPATP